MGYLFDQSCTSDFAPDNFNESEQVLFVGSSNPTQCLELIRNSLNFSECIFGNSSDCDEDKVPDVSNKKFLVRVHK